MASTDIARPTDRTIKRKPFSNWVKKITNFKGSDHPHEGNGKKGGIPLPGSKSKKNAAQNGIHHNNPYPESGMLKNRQPSVDSSANGQLTIDSRVSRLHNGSASFDSLPVSTTTQGREGQLHGNRSGAPSVATKPETINSDAGQSKAPTTVTGAGALSSIDGVGASSTFSSPNHSDRSLTTTLTTIQSQAAGAALQQSATGPANPHHHGLLNNPNPVMFSHQYPVSPSQSSAGPASAIPRHMNESTPNTYSSATANGLLSDNASILTLASSSNRRRRSIESHTDASVRAIPPSSVWGGSRESLPLSVLSGSNNADGGSGAHAHIQGRPSIGGLASTERTSIYSSHPAMASERNSYYAASHKHPTKDLGDAKSLRSITNIDARSQYDARSINEAKSLDVSSLKNYEGSVRSGAVGHGRNDSIPGSISSPLAASPALRHVSTSGALSRRSSDWQDVENKDLRDDEEDETNNTRPA